MVHHISFKSFILCSIHCMLTWLYISWTNMYVWFVQQHKKTQKQIYFLSFAMIFKNLFDWSLKMIFAWKYPRQCANSRENALPGKIPYALEKGSLEKCNLYLKVMKCYLGSQHKYECLNIRYKTIEAIRFKILLCNYTFCCEYYFHSSSFSFLLCYVLNARLTSERWI